MTQLSERISEILDENGDSLDYVSKTSNIGRITLNRIMTGEKMPSKEQLNSLCKVLRLSQPDIESLKKIYQIEKFGEFEFRKYLSIKAALEKLSAYADQKVTMSRQSDSFYQEKCPSLLEKENTDSIILSGEAEIRFCIACMIDKEMRHADSELQMQISRGVLNINQLVRETLSNQAKKIRVSEILYLPERSDNETMAELFSELPNLVDLSLLDSVHLETHYRYEQGEAYSIQEAGLRNCLLTKDCCLLFADDWESAVCHLDYNVVGFFGKKFDEMFRLSDDLFEVMNYKRGQNSFDGLTKKVINKNERALFSKAYLKTYLDGNSQTALSQNEWVSDPSKELTDVSRILYINDLHNFNLCGAIGIFSTPVKTWIHLITQKSEILLVLLEERLIKNTNAFLDSLVECELAFQIAHLQMNKHN